MPRITAATEAGGTLVGGPVFGHGDSGPRTAMLHDPDGVPVQLFDGEQVSIAQVIVNCTDLERSLRYYTDVMGLQPASEIRTVTQPGGRSTASTPTAACARSASKMPVRSSPSRSSSGSTRRSIRRRSGCAAANELGLFRMAWSTDDCARDEAIVRAAGSEPFAPTALAVGGRRHPAARGPVLARPRRRVPRADPGHRPVRSPLGMSEVGGIGDAWSGDGLAQAELIASGQASSRELVDAAIARIERLDPQLGAVVSSSASTRPAPRPTGRCPTVRSAASRSC